MTQMSGTTPQLYAIIEPVAAVDSDDCALVVEAPNPLVAAEDPPQPTVPATRSSTIGRSHGGAAIFEW